MHPVETAAAPNPVKPLFCVDCVHVRPVALMKFAQCTALPCQTVSLVEGYQNGYCVKLRGPRGKCGPSAVFFAHKDARPPQDAPDVRATTSPSALHQAELDSKKARLRQIQLQLEQSPEAGLLAAFSRERLEAESSLLALEIARSECAPGSSK
jgi:hypothetical protein